MQPYPDTFSVHLCPHLICAVDLPVGVPHPLDIGRQLFVALGSLAAKSRVALARSMAPVTRGGHLQWATNGLDPIHMTVLVYKTLQLFKQRSSSACTKKALAIFKISLARRSSLLGWASADVTPGRWPASICARLNHSIYVSGVQPILGAMNCAEAHSDGYSALCSCTIRTARSHTSGEKRFDLLFMTRSYRSILPPRNPG